MRNARSVVLVAAACGAALVLTMQMMQRKGSGDSLTSTERGAGAEDAGRAALAPAAGASAREAVGRAPSEPVPDPVPALDPAAEIDDPSEPLPANGLALRLEDAKGHPVIGAKVELHWRAGWGDYRDHHAVTDSRGELPSPLLMPFQLQWLAASPEGNDTKYETAGSWKAGDRRERGVMRFRLPHVAETTIRVVDAEGEPFRDAEVVLVRRKSLPLRLGVNVLQRDLGGDGKLTVTANAQGIASIELESGVYQCEASSPHFGDKARKTFGIDETERTAEFVLVMGEWEAKNPRSGLSARAPRPPARTVTGIVVDAVTGQPIAGAEVHLVNRLPKNGSGGGKRTSADGSFQVTESFGRNRPYVFVQANGYAWAACALPKTFEIDPVMLRMEPERSIRGRAVDAAGAPVLGTAHLFDLGVQVTSVSALPEGVPAIQRATARSITGPEGQIHLSRLGRGEYSLWFQPEDTALPPVIETVTAGNQELVVVVGEMPSELVQVSGVVRDARSGEPVPAMDLRFESEHMPIAIETSTDQDGAYVVRGLAPGTFQLSITHRAESAELRPYAFFESMLTVGETDEVHRFDLSPARRLMLRFTSSGDPPRRAVVAVFDRNGAQIKLQDGAGYGDGDAAYTDWFGRVDLLGLPADEVEVRVWREPSAYEAGADPRDTFAFDLKQPRLEIVPLSLR